MDAGHVNARPGMFTSYGAAARSLGLALLLVIGAAAIVVGAMIGAALLTG